jgi:hypothetical protein
VEEYGKILLLKQYTPAKGQVAIDYSKIFRDARHDNKARAKAIRLNRRVPMENEEKRAI